MASLQQHSLKKKVRLSLVVVDTSNVGRQSQKLHGDAPGPQVVVMLRQARKEKSHTLQRTQTSVP